MTTCNSQFKYDASEIDFKVSFGKKMCFSFKYTVKIQLLQCCWPLRVNIIMTVQYMCVQILAKAKNFDRD